MVTLPEGPSRELDRRFRGVGRVRLASGTTHVPTFRRLNEMLTVLYQTGRLDLIRAIRDRVLAPLQVLDAYRANRLETLPTAEMLVPLKEKWTAWLDAHDVEEKTRQGYREVAIHLDAVMTDAHTLEDLPALLATVRGTLLEAGKAATFNRLRSGCQAFLRVTLGEDHPLWRGVKGTRKLRETTKRLPRPQTVAQLDALCAAQDDAGRPIVDAEVSACLWSMATTGMGPGEYWGEWNCVADKVAPRIHIHGTKREGRERAIPDLGLCVVPPITRNAFRQRLLKQARAAGTELGPYDLRHTFATWMEDAHIPHSRLRSYLGHGKSNVTDVYLWREVKPYLAKDARRLLAYIRAERAKERAAQRELREHLTPKPARNSDIVPGSVPGGVRLHVS